MSTIVRQRKRTRLEPAQLEPAPRRAHRRWRGGLVLVTGLLIGLWATPIVIGLTPARHWILNWALADLRGKVTTGSVSLGWFSPITAAGILLADEQGHTVAEASALAGDRTLLGIICAPSNVGRIRLESPRITLVVRPDGSNLEDILAEWLKPTDAESSGGVGLGIDVIDGSLALQDSVSGEKWQINQIEAHITTPAAAADPLEAQIRGNVVQQDGPAEFQIALNDRAASDASRAGQAAVSIKRFPLGMMQAIARRFVPALTMAGSLNAEWKCEWGQDASGQALIACDGGIGAAPLLLSVPGAINDELRLEKIELLTRASSAANVLTLGDVQLACDAGRLAARGTIPDLNRLLSATTATEKINALTAGNVEASGQVALARLARLLPATLRIREGTEITSGDVAIQLSSETQNADVIWKGRVESSRLVALYDGREVAWDHPLRVELDGRHGDNRFTIDRLSCAADFIEVQGSGDPSAFRLNGQFDLARLAAELGKFLDLGGLQLAGAGTTGLEWQRTADGAFAAAAQFELADFQLAWPSAEPWTEKQMVVRAEARGLLDSVNVPQRIDSAKLTLDSGGDHFSAVLQKPVEAIHLGASWPLDIQAAGQLAAWMKRLTPFLGALRGWDIRGQAELVGAASVYLAGVDVSQARLTVKSLAIRGAGLNVNEPDASLEVSGRVTPAEQTFEIRQATLASATLDAQLRDAKLDWSEARPGMLGALTFRGDMTRLVGWLDVPALTSAWQIAGALQGAANIEQTGGVITAKADATVENVVLTPAGGRPIQQAKMHLEAGGQYDPAADAIRVEQFDLQTEPLGIQLTGDIKEFSQLRYLNVSGQSRCDWDKLTRLLQPYWGDGIRVLGQETRPFHVEGPLSTAVAANGAAPSSLMQSLKGEMAVGWQSADIYGFEFDRGVLTAQLADGLLRVPQTNIRVSGGMVHLAPVVRLEPGPAELYLPAGVLVEGVEITPRMCERGLQYVAPALNGVAQAQGKFSISIDGCRLPLANPSLGDVAGKFTVHSVDITPGPMIQELATLSGRSGVAKLKRESIVDFRLVQGRVYHQGMQLEFPDITIRTHGSVGLDKTLSLMAEMPVPPKWIGNNPLGDALRGQTIQIPLGGTIDRPQLDRRAIEQITAQFVRQAGENALRNELNKGIDKLFKLPGSQ